MPISQKIVAQYPNQRLAVRRTNDRDQIYCNACEKIIGMGQSMVKRHISGHGHITNYKKKTNA